jgi:hypothetical protein
MLLILSGKTVPRLEARTKSEAFRAAHNRAEENKPLYLDHPQYERFEVRQTDGKTAEWHEFKLLLRASWRDRHARLGTKV